MKCPKCGFQQANGRTDCSKCGIIFEKFKSFHKNENKKRLETTEARHEIFKFWDIISLTRLVKEEAIDWCKGRSWIVRLPILLWFAYLLMKLIKNPGGTGLFWGINFGIHEFGHVLFRPFGDILGLAGGSILQCLFPIIFMFAFLRYKDFFAISFCLGWLSSNIFFVSWYITDAAYSGPIAVNPFGNAGLHDWYNLLAHFLYLHKAVEIGYTVKLFGIIVMALCLTSGFWLLWHMYEKD